MINILFVCLGNICRSPTAEAVMRERVARRGMADRFNIDSAGILDAHRGEPADARMRRHAAKRGYDLTSISRPVEVEDFQRFDLLVGMDEQNRQDLVALAPDAAARERISLLLDHLPDADAREVPDPYYGGAAGFERVLDLVEDACDALLDQLDTSTTSPS